MNRFIKLLQNKKKSDGFTLVELMVAMLITSLVISATGFGLVTITNRDKREKAETQRRVELNRALDFIADEVRQAKPIATDADADLSTIASNFSSSGKTPVLTLKIPGVSQRVIYYIASSSSSWLGPNVVYRWGPNFNANGTYSNPIDPANWTYEPLADLILDDKPSSDPCNGWTLNPPLSGTPTKIKSFYACVDPSGRIADIHLRGKLVDAYGNSRDPLEVSSKVFARPGNSPFTLGVGSSNSGGNGGTVTITQRSTAYFEILGGGLNCNAGGPPIPTTATIYAQGATTTNQTLTSSNKAWNYSATVGTTLTVTGTNLGFSGYYNGSPYSCSSRYFNSATDNGTRVLSLRNGDNPPLFNPFGSQPPIDTFLTKYLDPATGKVRLAENQVIFLYELGSASSGSSFDMQDLVVLATVVPNSN